MKSGNLSQCKASLNATRNNEAFIELTLEEHKLWRKCVARDGLCLFRAVCDAIYISVCNNHFDVCYPMVSMEALAFCQALVYELLYLNVFRVHPIILNDTKAVARGEATFDEFVTKYNTDALLVPIRVCKAFNENFYRNIEFDNWKSDGT
ncbi:hypothetical protein Ciccas_003216 [Cichlidogyrus casuarinus]|uniref:OTU domain-containing protein n=1 Tax=Cichlidogyrus casuarinus TaxID=1844966 RepID=A0ABD2QF21_9PLAT